MFHIRELAGRIANFICLNSFTSLVFIYISETNVWGLPVMLLPSNRSGEHDRYHSDGVLVE